MENYGLSEYDLLAAREKIANQRDYLEKEEFITSNGQIKSLIDVSFSANHSYRYYSQLANKINTLESLAINENLTPNFLTMTLDGFYRDFLKGDYSRLIFMSKTKREEVFKSVPNNSEQGYILFKIQFLLPLSIKDLYKILIYQNKRFFASYAFKKLKKLNKKYIYIRTVEPHKNGVPHLHMMLFIPKDMITLFKSHFIKSFPAPRNSSSIAFQSDIISASAYIMKYITKSFLDIKSGKQLDYLNAWFVKYKIFRCVTSRSALPQWIYQKCSILEKDWYYLTDILKSPQNYSEWNQEQNCFWLYDNWNNREIAYEYGRLSVYSSGHLVKRVGKIIDEPCAMKSYEKVPIIWHKKKLDKVPIYINDKIESFYVNGRIVKNKKHIKDMSDIELYDYYINFDVDNSPFYVHYLAIHNELVKRGLLNSNLYNLNNFDFESFILEDES